MTANESTRSPFPTQPSARSPKLRIYESLLLLNQGVDRVVALLRGMEKFPFAHKDDLRYGRAQIEGVRADVNADFAEHLMDSERRDEGRFWKQRRVYEQKWRDPDDVYLSVAEREDRRRKLGLPQRVGILPYSAVAAEEEHWETELDQKKERSRKRRKSASRTGRKAIKT